MDTSHESPLVVDIKNGRRLNSDRFTLYTHCVRQGDFPQDLWDFEKATPNIGWKYVGWCPSASTPIPKSNWPGMEYCVAVLLENDKEEEVWLHVPVIKEMLEAISKWLY